MVSLLTFSCNGQDNETKKIDSKSVEKPKGSWKVDKEFDSNGNLIRYDSIYAWSSRSNVDTLSSFQRDSVIQTIKSRFFTNYSDFKNQGFEEIFSQDSLFSKRFFNDDFFESEFANDLLDVDKMRQEMLKSQKLLLEKYQSEFIKPKDEN